MNEYQQACLDFARALPEVAFSKLASMIKTSATGDQLVLEVATTGKLVWRALNFTKLNLEELQRLADVVGVQAAAMILSPDELKSSIQNQMSGIEIRCMLGDLHESFEVFVAQVRSRCTPIVVLRRVPPNSEDTQPVAYLNPVASFETDWIHLDLRSHPDAGAFDNKSLSVLNNENRKQTNDPEVLLYFHDAPIEQPSGWIPLYGHTFIELPSGVMFPDARFERPYQMVANSTNLSEGIAGIEAQMGGMVFDEFEGDYTLRIFLRTATRCEPILLITQESDNSLRAQLQIT